MINLKQYENITDKFNSLFTILIFDTKYKDFNYFLKEKLEKIQNISNSFKRKYFNDRLYNFIIYLDNIYKNDNIINSVYFISKNIIEHKLDKEIDELQNFNIKNILYFNDEFFKIDYLNDLLYNINYRHVIHINNKTINYSIITKTKGKNLITNTSGKINIKEFIKDNNIKFCLIYGVSSILRNLDLKQHILFQNNLTKEKILEEFNNYDMLKLHKRLNETIDLINNEKTINRVVFGKDLINAINFNQIKTLFCSPKKLKKVYDNFEKDILNFEIIEIKSLDKGDIGEKFRKEYNGIIGYTYY
jgi:hypothetical protein